MPAGRPAENRVKMTLHVKPETAKAINAAVEKTDPKRNTQGKIVDRAMVAAREKKRRSK